MMGTCRSFGHLTFVVSRGYISNVFVVVNCQQVNLILNKGRKQYSDRLRRSFQVVQTLLFIA